MGSGWMECTCGWMSRDGQGEREEKGVCGLVCVFKIDTHSHSSIVRVDVFVDVCCCMCVRDSEQEIGFLY